MAEESMRQREREREKEREKERETRERETRASERERERQRKEREIFSHLREAQCVIGSRDCTTEELASLSVCIKTRQHHEAPRKSEMWDDRHGRHGDRQMRGIHDLHHEGDD